MTPGPRGLAENLRAALWLRRDTLGFLEQAHAKWGQVFQFGVGPVRMVVLHRPEDLKSVLVDNAAAYEKSARIKAATRVVIGEGLFTADGEKWKRNRRIVQPAFSRSSVNGFVPTIVECASELVARVESFARSGQVFDGALEAKKIALWVALRCFFGVNDPTTGAELRDAIDFSGEYANQAFISAVPMPTWAPTPRNLKFRRYARMLRAFVRKMIAERRVSGTITDLVGRLLAARDEETGVGLDEEQIIDELLTFYVAGHDTTANGLAFCFDLLARHPDVQERVRDEAVRVLGRRAPTPDDLPKLTYTLHVFEEALRLYPPAWAVARTAVSDQVVGGCDVAAGSNLMCNIWFAQRDPRFWDDPLKFDPDRFEEARAAKRPKLCYLPFGAGQRQCIGAGFALNEAQIALAMLLRDYQLEPAGEPVEPLPRFILTQRTGVMLRARPVSAAAAVA